MECQLENTTVHYEMLGAGRPLVVLHGAAGDHRVAAATIEPLFSHRLYGLDITIWSIPHLMFFFGSTIALIGLLTMWLHVAVVGWWRTAYTMIFLTLLTDCAMFVLGQHEYGVLSVAAFRSGRPIASDDLLALAHGDVAGFATGWMPAWVYPIWMVLAGTLVLMGARRAQPGRWTATSVAALYLAYRGAGYILLVAAKFPPSFIPVMLLSAGVVLDVAARWHWRSIVTTAALLLAWYGSAAVVGRLTLMPTFAPATLWIVAADAAGFLDFARSLPTPVVYEAIQDASPLTSIFGYCRTENVRRYYKKLPRFLDGLITLGDAVRAFNPVYGQGRPLQRLVPKRWTSASATSADVAQLANWQDWPNVSRRNSADLSAAWDSQQYLLRISFKELSRRPQS